MIDFARIVVKAGSGGNGAGSFEHIKGKRRGKADGGDGGRGGNVYIIASVDLNTLEPFRFVKEYKAENGRDGLSKKRTGAEGSVLDIKVPVGTQVKIRGQLFDILKPNDRILVARGGEGGRGNRHLRDELGRRPLKGEKGENGEEVELELQLKLIADVGLVGLPNAGKSTIISKLTSATPKIAPYPFTTLEPNLGILHGSWLMVHGSLQNEKKLDERFTINDKRVVIADIPGLIEGASSGRGLGDLFLRHIERTKILVHVVDVASEDIIRDYLVIRAEIKAYSKDLAKKKEIIVLNKIDLIDQDLLREKIDLFKRRRRRVFAVCALDKTGFKLLVGEIIKRLF